MEEEAPLTAEQKEFVKGFNSGYLLEKHTPELIFKIQPHISESKVPYVAGINKGILEFKKERIIE